MFADALIAAQERQSSRLVVGLDPRIELIPEDLRAGDPASALRSFSLLVLETLAGVVPAVKLQVAFFERHGPAGFSAFFDVARAARERGFLVIGDVKRGDIGSTAEAYAEAYLGPDAPFDAITVNPLFGSEGIEPFLKFASARGKGIFVLVRTSNRTAGEIQGAGAGQGGATDAIVALMQRCRKAEYTGRSGYSLLGAVVGATDPAQIPALRRALPETLFLLPGVGAQGGRPADLAPAFDRQRRGGLVTASRSLTYPWLSSGGPVPARPDCIRAIREAALTLNAEMEEALARR